MATPINTPLTGEIWHLSIDDLLAPLPAAPRLGGPGPFVINLSASTAPISQPIKGIVGCEHAHVYQIQRTEDRRVRYRLRLGPFASEDAADAILEKVRDIYPSALTATAEADDLRAIAAIQAKLDAQLAAHKPVEKAAAATAVDVAPPAPATASIPVLTTVATHAGPRAVRAAPAVAAVTVPAPPPKSAVPRAAPASTVQRSWQEIARTILASPAWASAPAAVAVPTTVAPPAPVAVPTTVAPPAWVAPTAAVAPPAAVAVPRHVQQLDTRLESLETTQTIRALTTLELQDEDAARWYVIQMSLAERAFDPDSLPNLDIFNVYRLYSVAGLDQGRLMHALRLGFFSEEAAARAVASYLAAYYEQPTVKRVSAAERDRFADQQVEARKDIGATGKHAVIEITDELVVRESRGSSSVAMSRKADQSFSHRTVAHKGR
jgi:SPOR domain